MSSPGPVHSPAEPAGTYRDFPLPHILEEATRAWLAGEIDEVAPAKPSASVMLVRDARPSHDQAGGIEVFVLRRASTMAFAPNMVVFPGGGVDPRDADPSVPWAGPSPQEWADRVGAPVDQARELVIAAAREVFEEVGVLLAGRDEDSLLTDLDPAEWAPERDRLLAREQSFGELLIRRGLVLRTDLLRLRGHWITPECERRRYDTRFFAARMPQGQTADDRSTEAVEARWVSPAQALEDSRTGAGVLLPVTTVMMEQLDALGSAQAALDDDPEIHVVLPAPTAHDDALWLRARVGPDGHGLPQEPGTTLVAEG